MNKKPDFFDYDIAEITRDFRADLEEIQQAAKKSVIQWIINLAPIVAGFIIMIYSFLSINSVLSNTVQSLAVMTSDPESALGNISEVAVLLTSESIMMTNYWGIMGIGIFIFSFGAAWIFYREGRHVTHQIQLLAVLMKTHSILLLKAIYYKKEVDSESKEEAAR